MKKLIALLLCLTLCAGVLVSCSGNQSENPDDANTETFDYDFPQNIADADYDGKEFRIATWAETGGDHWGAYEFYYDKELTGDVVNDAVLKRDTVLEQKYNIEIVYDVHNKGDLTEDARTSITAGSDDFDVLSTDMGGAATLAKEGLFHDLYDFSDILNLEEEYWDPNATEQLSVDNHLFFTTSDLTLVDKQATWVLFFTKGLLAKYPSLTEGYENGIYSMVEEGEWTIEKMSNMVKTVAQDANGDNDYTDIDVYGHCGEQFNLAALMVGCGSVITEKDENDIPQYIWGNKVDQYVESYGYVYEIVMDSKFSMLSTRMGGYGYKDLWIDGFGGMMQEERVLFNCTGMNRCKLYRNIEAEFGIVPVPKANEAQDRYYSLMSMGQANTIAIPITVENPEFVASMLEVMTCIASQTTYSAYIDKALAYKYLDGDEDSRAMMDIIFDSRLYDPVDVYGWGESNTSMYGKAPQPTAIASTIKSFERITNNRLKNGIKKFQEIYAVQQED